MISRRTLLAAVPLAAACRRQAGSGYRGFAFIAGEEEASVAVVDLMAFALKGRIPLSGPAILLLRHPGKARTILYAFSANARVADEIDTVSRKRLRSIKLNGVPVAARTEGNRMWCLLRETPQLVPLEGRGIALPAQPVDFDISPKAALACVTLEDGSAVFVDLANRRVLGAVGLGIGLGAVRFRSDGKLAVVAECKRRQLAVLDTAARQVMTQLPLALSPDRVCVNGDGGQMFMTGEGRDAVVIAYPYRTEIAQTSLSGRKPGAMAVSRVPEFLFVSNPQSGSVTVFDIATQKVLAVIGVGMEPGAIAVTPDQQYALVLNRASGDVAVIRMAAITGGRGKSAPLFTMIPVGARPGAIQIMPPAG